VTFREDNWKESAGSCVPFQKEYVCIHVLGIATFKSLFHVPDVAKTDLLETKRKLGRPRKAGKSLIVD